MSDKTLYINIYISKVHCIPLRETRIQHTFILNLLFVKVKNSNTFTFYDYFYELHYSFSLFLFRLVSRIYGNLFTPSPGIHVLTRLISRRDKASDRIMSHGLARWSTSGNRIRFFVPQRGSWMIANCLDEFSTGDDRSSVRRRARTRRMGLREEGHVFVCWWCKVKEKIFFLSASFIEIFR